MASVGATLEVAGLTKRFGDVLAVDDLSFVVSPGQVTGFLGPNGSGKTTTMRCLLGLVTPTSGTATIGGTPYRDLAEPLRIVGASLEAADFHPGRTAMDHLRYLALAAGLPTQRVDEVLELVGMSDVARRRVGGFSLGMRQRLALGQALLGDPGVLLLDEPANGLDPAGIAWLRLLLKHLADQGRTVLVSSHVLSEVQQTVDHVVVIARGRLIRQGRLTDLAEAERAVVVRTPAPESLAQALDGWAFEHLPDGMIRVPGRTPAEVGHRAHQHGVELHELSAEQGTLERVFLELTEGGAR